MSIEVTFSQNLENNDIFILVQDIKKHDHNLEELNQNLREYINKLLSHQNRPNKFGEYVSACYIDDNNLNNIVIMSIGDEKSLDLDLSNNIGAEIYKICSSLKLEKISLISTLSENNKIDKKELVANIGLGFLLKSYKFNKYFTHDKHKEKLAKLNIIIKNFAEAKTEFDKILPIYKYSKITRDLISEPSNKLYPENYAEFCRNNLASDEIKITILSEEEMINLGMEAVIGVAKGSSKSPKMVILEYNGAKNNDKPIILVGKGVTFDSGGISIKPSANMDEMKYDMAGSAIVFGTINVLAARKAKVNAISIMVLVENMPDGNAQKPGDIVKSMSGQTIEVLNTDAEGRLILADALHYCQEKFNPKIIIDLATLTGAIVVALANVYAGLFSNNDELSENLFKAGEKTGEKLWRLPLSKEYNDMIDSKIADMQNISNGKGAGSITAAQFLQRFIKKDIAWAHIDIAGVAWADKEKKLYQKGATGFGIRLLNQLIKDYYEI